jgi:hypothetical protein
MVQRQHFYNFPIQAKGQYCHLNVFVEYTHNFRTMCVPLM